MSTGNTQLKIALVMPAYNEGPVIGNVIRDLRACFKDTPYTPTIIVVDDGSKDNTADEAAAAGAYVIKHILNTGSGGATATGLSYAQQKDFEIAVTVDADGQHDSKDVLKGINLLIKTKTDLLVGSRLINTRGMSTIKLLGNKSLTLITYVLFGIKVTDSQSGLRIFSKKALNELKWKTSGYEFCSEMLWRAKQTDLIVDEFPAKAIYTEYSRTKGQSNWNGFNIIKSLLVRRVLEFFGE